MTRVKQISTDLIRIDLPRPCHRCAIILLVHYLHPLTIYTRRNAVVIHRFTKGAG